MVKDECNKQFKELKKNGLQMDCEGLQNDFGVLCQVNLCKCDFNFSKRKKINLVYMMSHTRVKLEGNIFMHIIPIIISFPLYKIEEIRRIISNKNKAFVNLTKSQVH